MPNHVKLDKPKQTLAKRQYHIHWRELPKNIQSCTLHRLPAWQYYGITGIPCLLVRGR